MKQKQCPKDADKEYEGNPCNEHSDFWSFIAYCKRKEGHKGKHHCHGLFGNCVATW